MIPRRLSFFALAVATLGLTACGGDEIEEETPITTDFTQVEPAAPAPYSDPEAVIPYAGPAFEMTMTPVGEQMEFEQKEFTVRPGQTVVLTFNNTASNPAMSHNVVVLKADSDVTEVGQAAMGAAANDYIPAAKEDQIIAHTPMAAPGETVEVTFTAPAVGDYPYICTYPGHYMTMQGTMHVVAE